MFHHQSIQTYQASLQNGSVTCTAAVQHYLRQIEASKRLNAFVQVYAEEALARAAALDEARRAGRATGRLHGVVIGIKDVLAYKDHNLSAASRILDGFQSLYSATAIERLLAEEAIIIGSLNCDEFAMGSSNENSAYGPVRNALDEERVPGGSSGGSAVAVQAGLCMASLGSDTGGSVRQPADFCGIPGFKPGYGRISRYGLVAYASSFDCIGIFARQVEDIALLLEIMAGADGYDSTAGNEPVPPYFSAVGTEKDRKYRFAYWKEALTHPGLDPEIGLAIREKINALQADGHTVEAVDFEYLDYIVPAYYVLTTAEASSNLSRYDGVKFGYRTPEKGLDLTQFYSQTRSAGFGREVKRRIMLGAFVLSAGYYDAYFGRAQQVRRRLVERTQLIFNEFDFLLSPTVPATAFKIGEKTDDPIAIYLADIFTVFANLTGIPAISLPLFRHSNGLPFGLQVMANRHNELPLLRLSNQLMQQ